MNVDIAGSFEVPSQEEWDKYLATDIFNDMNLEPGTLGESEDVFQNIGRPRLHEIITEHNNKVGALRITYALCRHYYDKGIPDDPWFISPGSAGQSVEYFPNFKEEHWMRKHWFTYFADTFYLKISSVWDSIIEIIDEYYQYGIPQDLRFRSEVFKRLKEDNPDLFNVFAELQKNDLYIEAQKYRTEAAHGTSAGDVHNTISTQRDVETEITKIEGGHVVRRPVKAAMVVSFGVGEYTLSKTIMENIENYSKHSGAEMQRIINLLES